MRTRCRLPQKLPNEPNVQFRSNQTNAYRFPPESGKPVPGSGPIGKYAERSQSPSIKSRAVPNEPIPRSCQRNQSRAPGSPAPRPRSFAKMQNKPNTAAAKTKQRCCTLWGAPGVAVFSGKPNDARCETCRTNPTSAGRRRPSSNRRPVQAAFTNQSQSGGRPSGSKYFCRTKFEPKLQKTNLFRCTIHGHGALTFRCIPLITS